ncbi:TPA: hypothetical protein ACH3X2_008284 [Trebouxia sp. C0005]
MRLQRNVSTIAGLGMTQGARAFGTVGLPLFVLTVSGFYGLSHLVQGKFDVQAQRQKVVDLKVDPEKQKSFSLEEELQKLRNSVDINNYENKPVPRTEDE